MFEVLCNIDNTRGREKGGEGYFEIPPGRKILENIPPRDFEKKFWKTGENGKTPLNLTRFSLN